MIDGEAVDTKEIAQRFRGRAPPYKCPACLKFYRSLTGIMYHIGQFGAPTDLPRCMLGDESPQGSPRPSPGSPGMLKRKTPRRDLTWAEAQRMVEVEFESGYKRIEIDHDVDVNVLSDLEEQDGGRHSAASRKTPRRLVGLGTPVRTGKGYTPRGKSKNKGKRRWTKLKTSSKGGQGDGSAPLPQADVTVLDSLDFPDAPERGGSYYRFVEQSAEDLDDLVEYDMDEEDYQWLSLVNEERKGQGMTSIPQGVFEILMDRLEKECFFESHMAGDGGDASNMYNIDENAVCTICNDGECHNTNAILFCDMCNLAVHQECYGVPYIPEGQWLCRRCLQSPSRGVDCVLCPNKGGAFKQTVDGRWAHVICALWIPEVQFSNTVFLEPIDGIREIPPARWKLTCYVCRKRMGASIQCAKANCYVAFHVTCAQQAGLHMKIEIIKGGEIRKTAYCDTHTPPSVKRKKEKQEASAKLEKEKESSNSESEAENQEEEREEGEEGEGEGKSSKRKGKGESLGLKKARRILEERRSSMQPVVNIPYVPQHRLDRIISRVSLHKKAQFIPKLVNYWKLKRQSRNGVPLLRRLQASNHGQRTAVANLTEEEREVLTEQLSLWKSLRHDLERARMLVELVRKREKLKREQLRLLQHIHELQLRPLNVVMKRILDRLARKDPADIFAEPVPAEEVPDYLEIIKHPMDFGTMRKKVEANQYNSLDEFEKDFYLVWHNATIYNQKDTIYHRAAVRIKDAGYKILEQAREQLAGARVDRETGLHNPKVVEPPPLTPTTITTVIHQPMEIEEPPDQQQQQQPWGSASRDRLSSSTSISLDEQVEFLEEKLGVLQTQYVGAARKVREKALRRELNALRRQMRQERKAARTGSESDDHMTTPRKQPQPITRNAQELASHVLHGSLRLTPSRQQILSNSGIRLQEKASTLQEEEALPIEVAASSESALEISEPTPQEPVQQETPQKPKRGPGRPPRSTHSLVVSKSDSYVAKIKKKARQVQKRKYQRERSRTGITDPRRPGRPPKQRLPSAGSVSEAERSVNGVSNRREKGRTRVGSSSSIYETAMEGYSSEERLLRSPLSDSSLYRQRLASSTSENAAPSASSTDDLTVRAPVVPRGARGRKRKHGERRAGTKRKKRAVSDPDSAKRTGTINGLVNGSGNFEIKALDLVWAKCRGYPPYPALVIDPDMPSKGLSINGEKIQAPSDEVLELRDKNPTNTYLVRFFDGRRSWQWLPPEKIEPLGVSHEYDTAKVSASGASKRSVQQAYQRARQYQRRVSRNTSNTTTNDEDEDSDS